MPNHPTGDSRPARDFDDAEFLRGLPRAGGAPVVGPVKVGSRISKGGMGVIYRGYHTKLDIDVAVKFLLPDRVQENSDDVRRFVREARLAAQLNSENLVRVFDVNSQGKYHYVVMEFVRGETARERVERKGPLAESEALDIVIGAARGLDAAHRKSIVHRDIKPDNIMIDVTGLVKLADLGIAKAHGEAGQSQETITQPGLLIGTPAYMAPEQMKFHGQVGSAADIYSMGSTLYYFLTGKPPYEGTLITIIQAVTMKGFPDIRKERPQISEPVLRLLDRCTRSDARQRFQNAAALLEEIKRLGHERRSLATAAERLPTAQTSARPPPAVPRQKAHLQKPATVDREVRAKIAAQRRGSAKSQPGRQTVAGSYLVVLLLGACLSAATYYTYREFLDDASRQGTTARAMERPAAPPSTGPEAQAADPPLEEPPPPAATPVEATESAEPAERERWEELSPAESSPIKALLEAWPAREKEVQRLLASLCAADGGKGAGIACELAHSEFLAFLRKLPAAGASREELESLVAFLASTPPPPAGFAALRVAHDEERRRVLSVYLASASREARSLLGGGDPAGAAALLDQILRFARQWKLAPISPRAVLELQDLRNKIPDPVAFSPKAAEEPAPTPPVEPPHAPAASEASPAAEAQEVPRDLPWAQGLASAFQTERAHLAGVPLALEISLGAGVTMRLLYVPDGSFLRGGGPEGPPRKVKLSRGFYLGIHEVTWDQWRAVTDADPPGVPLRRRGKDMGDLPATGVSWTEAAHFCRLVSERLAAEGTHGRLRLPTEAEWEYACRAGSHSLFPWGDEFSDDHTWYWMNSQRRPQQVGSKRPNAWGFFDVLGNVNEWCADWLEPLPHGDLADPVGPASGTIRALRGGSWKDYKGQIRPGLRRGFPPDRGDPETGFRVAMDR